MGARGKPQPRRVRKETPFGPVMGEDPELQQAEAKAAREAAAKRLGISRCYKCNWPGKPGDSCPNCSTGDDVVALPSAPARSAGGGGVRFSSSRSVLSQRLPLPFDRAAAGLSHN